jgi:hypothetical protein
VVHKHLYFKGNLAGLKGKSRKWILSLQARKHDSGPKVACLSLYFLVLISEAAHLAHVSEHGKLA